MANAVATKFWDETLGGGSYKSVSVADALEKQKAGSLLVDARPSGDSAVSTVKGAVPLEEYEKKLEAGELKDTEVSRHTSNNRSMEGSYPLPHCVRCVAGCLLLLDWWRLWGRLQQK